MLFSIVIPIFKVEKYITRGVDFVLEQTFGDFELIMVDDGSPDSCGDMCEAAARRDSRIRVIHQRNAGPGPARNAGMCAANGEYVMFFDIDDILHSDALSILAEKLLSEKPQLLIFGYNEVNQALGTATPYRFTQCKIERNSRLAQVYPEELSGMKFNNGFVWNKVYNRRFLNECGVSFEPLAIQQDEVFNNAVYRYADRVIITDEVLYDYYIYNSGNNRSRFIPDRLDIYRRVRDSFFELADYWKLNDRRFDAYIWRRFFESIIIGINYNLYHPDNHLSKSGKRSSLADIMEADDVQKCIIELKRLNAVPTDTIKQEYFKAIARRSVQHYLAVKRIDNALSAIKTMVKPLLR